MEMTQGSPGLEQEEAVWYMDRGQGQKSPADAGELSSVLPFQSPPMHTVESGPVCPQQVLHPGTTPILAFVFSLPLCLSGQRP